MLIYLLDEDDTYLKLQVVKGDPFSLSWTSKVYKRSSKGTWEFHSRACFECSLRTGAVLTIKGKNHKVSRFYIQRVI